MKRKVTIPWTPINFLRTDGSAPIVLICEHASNNFPEDFSGLGLDEAARMSHAAWDIGALAVASTLSESLDAPLVSCGVSRMLYDCNRPLSAPDCIPAKSELIAVPGNEDLSAAQRNLRYRLIHEPFHLAASGLIAAQQAKLRGPVAIVTIHSFTPVYYGKPRDVEIGFLHHGNAELSIAAHGIEREKGRYRAELNEPYDAADGVTYSLCKHADVNRLHSTMVEIRNDLVDTEAKAIEVGEHLAETLRQAVAEVLPTGENAR